MGTFPSDCMKDGSIVKSCAGVSGSASVTLSDVPSAATSISFVLKTTNPATAQTSQSFVLTVTEGSTLKRGGQCTITDIVATRPSGTVTVQTGETITAENASVDTVNIWNFPLENSEYIKEGSIVTIKENSRTAANAISWNGCNTNKAVAPGFTLCAPLGTSDGAKFTVGEVLKTTPLTINVSLKNSPGPLIPKFEVAIVDDKNNKEGETTAPHLTSATKIVKVLSGSATVANTLINETNVSYTFLLEGRNSERLTIQDNSVLTIKNAAWTFPTDCSMDGDIVKSCAGVTGTASVTLSGVGATATSLSFVLKANNPNSAQTSKKFALSLSTAGSVLERGGECTITNIEATRKEGAVTLQTGQKIRPSDIMANKETIWTFPLKNSEYIKKGSIVTIKESSRTATNAISWTKCNTVKSGTTPGFTLCSPLGTSDGAKFTVDEVMKTEPLTIKVLLKNSPKALAPKFEVEILDDKNNKEGATAAPLTDVSKIVDTLGGTATTVNKSVGEETVYIFGLTKTGANIDDNQKLEISAAGFGFSMCDGGRLSGPVKSCTVGKNHVTLTLKAISDAQFSFTLGIQNKNSVEIPSFQLEVKKGTDVTHKGVAVGEKLVQTPFLRAQAFYDSAEDTVSDIIFEIHPKTATLDNAGFLIIEALTSGYTMTASGGFPKLGKEAILVADGTTDKVNEIKDATKINFHKVKIEANSHYSVSMRLKKPAASTKCEFQVTIKDTNDLEVGKFTGAKLTSQEIMSPNISVASRAADTS
eukprot:Platyproteum_vivax@DN7682_c2_g1_i7.p1